MCVCACMSVCRVVYVRERDRQRQRLSPGECWIVRKFKLGKLL